MTDYVGRRGLILSYDEHRAFGDLELEGGEHVRFGGPEVARLGPVPGAEVRVVEMGHTYSGELKVTRLELVGVLAEGGWVWPALREGQPGRVFDVARWAALHPEWVDAREAERRVLAPCAGATPLRGTLRPHPFFDPWREGVAQTAALALGLTYRVGQVAPHESRVGGTTAELLGPWPTCAECAEPLILVAQLFLAELPALFDEGGVLTLMVCPDHVPATHAELAAGRGALRYTPPEVALATTHRSLTERLRGARMPSRHLEAVPRLSFPPPQLLTGPLGSRAAAELFSVHLEAGSGLEAYREWTDHAEGQSHLGGYAHGQAAIEAPTCSHCAGPMQLVVELTADTELPIDGGLCVFACRATKECGGLSHAHYVKSLTGT